MPTEQQRERNRATQRLFQKQHPGYSYRYVRRKRILNPVFYKHQAQHRTFELVDPRDPDQLPRVIGYCKITNDPVWSALWAMKDISNSPWAAWLRELAATGLSPVERFGWALGSVIPINRHLACRLAHERIKHINVLTTSRLYVQPPWLLRGIGAMTRNRPTARLRPDGIVDRYPRLTDAIQVVGPSMVDRLRYWIQTIGVSPDGCIWFDD